MSQFQWVRVNDIDDLASKLGCQIGDLPSSYMNPH